MNKVALSFSYNLDLFRKFIPNIHVADSSTVGEFDLIIIPDGPTLGDNFFRSISNMTSSKRDLMEYDVIRRAKSMGKKVYGIGRGFNLISYIYLNADTVIDTHRDRGYYHPSVHELYFPSPRGIFYRFFNRKSVHSTHPFVCKEYPSSIRCSSYYTYEHYLDVESVETTNLIASLFRPELDESSMDFFRFLQESF